jgi:hypothetical protein
LRKSAGYLRTLVIPVLLSLVFIVKGLVLSTNVVAIVLVVDHGNTSNAAYDGYPVGAQIVIIAFGIQTLSNWGKWRQLSLILLIIVLVIILLLIMMIDL